jgi:hypothetical protein
MPDKPSPKVVDDLLFRHASTDIAKLNKKARGELRLKARAEWKMKQNALNNPAQN